MPEGRSVSAKSTLRRGGAIVLQRADYSRMTYCRKSVGFPNIFFAEPHGLRTFAMETSKKAPSHFARPTQKLNKAAHHKASPSFRYLGKHKVIGFRIIGEAVRTPHGSRGTVQPSQTVTAIRPQPGGGSFVDSRAVRLGCKGASSASHRPAKK